MVNNYWILIFTTSKAKANIESDYYFVKYTILHDVSYFLNCDKLKGLLRHTFKSTIDKSLTGINLNSMVKIKCVGKT